MNGDDQADTPAQAVAPHWALARAPALADFEVMAAAAFAALPEHFRSLCEGVVVQVQDFPPDDVLEDMSAESEFDILGLFTGRGLAQGGADLASGQLPNMVFLYRRPILDYWVGHDEALGDIVTHVLVHEIGHHFGLSDADMERIEQQAGG